ncbi:hypothetical protein TNCV_325191 [Trichonephila clavipes]|nr:hypothetical protein TNCV_325191 [Trichonephila clavipes]
MGGVDRFDQRKERYPIRRSLKWWHRILFFLIDIAIINSFIQWQEQKMQKFRPVNIPRIALARQLIDKRRKLHTETLDHTQCVEESIRAPLQTQILGRKSKHELGLSQALGPSKSLPPHNAGVTKFRNLMSTTGLFEASDPLETTRIGQQKRCCVPSGQRQATHVCSDSPETLGA